MSSIIQVQATMPLYLHVSGLTINGLSLGSNGQVFSLAHNSPGPSVTESSQPLTQIPLPPDHPSNFLEFLQPDSSIECPDHEFEAFLLGESPRMLYIEGFLSEEERLHVIENSNPDYTPASVYNPTTNEATSDGEYRRSETALLYRDPVVKCIEKRAQSLQQWTNMALEPLSVQRYQRDGYFLHHLDAIGASTIPDRKSTFNVWLEGNCTGGGTHFPMISRWEDPALCAFLDCDAKENGTVFKPLAGNALFWENVGPDGSPYEETVHAGLSVLDGTKIGLNIWTWVFPDDDLRGQSV